MQNCQWLRFSFQKVPGRMGMIVTLYLIHTNVYNCIDAPHGRGFSYIEIWMIGTQIPILLALTEYGFILGWKKVAKKLNQIQQMRENKSTSELNEKIMILDIITMICSLLYFTIFIFIYIMGNPLNHLVK